MIEVVIDLFYTDRAPVTSPVQFCEVVSKDTYKCPPKFETMKECEFARHELSDLMNGKYTPARRRREHILMFRLRCAEVEKAVS